MRQKASPGFKVRSVSAPGVRVTTEPSTVKVVSTFTGGITVDFVPTRTVMLPPLGENGGTSESGFVGLGLETVSGAVGSPPSKFDGSGGDVPTSPYGDSGEDGT